MTLADLRKVAIRKQTKIRFRIANGMDCIINEHGIAQVPALRSVPDFNLEQELAGVTQFTLEPVPAADAKSAPKPQLITREALAAMSDGNATAAHDHDHDDE